MQEKLEKSFPVFKITQLNLMTTCPKCGKAVLRRENSGFRASPYYATDSYFVYILKMEYVSEINIFCLKMMVKSGLEFFILKFLHAGNYFLLFHKMEGFCPKLQIQ